MDTFLQEKMFTIEKDSSVSSRKAEMSNPRQNRIQNHTHFPNIQQSGHHPKINNVPDKIISYNLSTA